ncbi:MAG: MAPEG family protein [Xanthobacteraceae bacterium]
MPLAYWCVLVAAILPLAIVVYAKAGSDGDNHHPRDSAERLPPASRRAFAAHLNAYENFPFFAAAVIIAKTQGAPLGTLNALAAIYIVLRIAHAGLYIGDYATPRSVVFAMAWLINIAIFVLPVF